MLSKEMHTLLKNIPRHPDTISFSELFGKKLFSLEELKSLLCDAIHSDYEYATQHQINGRLLQDSSFSLTEKGKAAIEEYNQNSRNLEVMEKSLSISRAAMVAAIASAIAAFLTILPTAIEWISKILDLIFTAIPVQ